MAILFLKRWCRRFFKSLLECNNLLSIMPALCFQFLQMWAGINWLWLVIDTQILGFYFQEIKIQRVCTF